MVLSYVAQSARGTIATAIPQSEIDKAHTVVERMMIRWRGEPDPVHVRAIDAYFVSAAEHGMNASTFTGRVIARTCTGSGSPRQRIIIRSTTVCALSISD